MKRYALIIATLSLLTVQVVEAQLVPNLGGQRAGISGLQFLKIGVGSREAAVGEAAVALATDVSAVYWNPAGLALADRDGILFAHAEWLVEMQHDFLGACFRLSPHDVVGVSVLSLSTDDMESTTETQPFGTGRYFSYRDLAVGVTYARQMTNQFSFGVTLRYARETLDVLRMNAVLFDLGTFYWVGLGTMRFGVVVTNFGSDVRPVGDAVLLNGTPVSTFQSFSPPTVFKLGFAVEPYTDEQHRITTSVQLNHPNDNAEHVRLGVEYAWQGWLFARMGIKRTIGEPFFLRDRKSAGDLAMGLGVKVDVSASSVSFDYALTDYGELGFVHRITMGVFY